MQDVQTAPVSRKDTVNVPLNVLLNFTIIHQIADRYEKKLTSPARLDQNCGRHIFPAGYCIRSLP
jgi:hypothetical protein